MATSFRIDDISLNTDQNKIEWAVGVLGKHGQVTLAVSPLCCELDDPGDRKGWNYHAAEQPSSEPLGHYLRMRKMGVPQWALEHQNRWEVASHGLIHADHRLLNKQAQELSIVLSCNLVNATIFVPPFHKYNKDTEEVCNEHFITLDKWDSYSSRHIGFHMFEEGFNYYLHEWDFTEKLIYWVNRKSDSPK